MILVQLFLIPVYRRLSFTLGFWSFTFPVAAAAAYGIEWLSLAAFDGWKIVAVLVGLVPTAVIVAVGIRSIVLVSSVRRGARRAEQSLRHADDVVTRPTARV